MDRRFAALNCDTERALALSLTFILESLSLTTKRDGKIEREGGRKKENAI